MRAVVYRGINDLRVETVPVPRIGAHELLVKVAVCGVCPTDIKKIQHGTVPPPRIFGHETAGTIVKIGTGNSSLVTRHSSLKVGDRVALHHHVPCLDCHYCRHRAYAQCATYKRTGITAGFEPAGGGYAEYVCVMPFVLPGVVKIPAKNSLEEGALLEPVNTVLKAVRRLNLLRGDTVLVAGQGPIGLMFTRLLQLQGVRVLATDLLASRLRLAKKFGARWTRLIRSPQSTACNPSLAEDCGLKTVDSAIVAVPSDAVVQQALQLVRGGGQVLLFAHTKRSSLAHPMGEGGPGEAGPGEGKSVPVSQLGRDGSPSRPSERTRGPRVPTSSSLSAACGGEGRPVLPSRATAEDGGEVAAISHLRTSISPIDLASICLDEKDLLGSYSSDFTLQREVARLVFSRQLDVRRLITHRFPLEQTSAAVALAANPKPDSLKILVCQDRIALSHRSPA
jgi:L-iditol 2-dehydrogenase